MPAGILVVPARLHGARVRITVGFGGPQPTLLRANRKIGTATIYLLVAMVILGLGIALVLSMYLAGQPPKTILRSTVRSRWFWIVLGSGVMLAGATAALDRTIGTPLDHRRLAAAFLAAVSFGWFFVILLVPIFERAGVDRGSSQSSPGDNQGR